MSGARRVRVQADSVHSSACSFDGGRVKAADNKDVLAGAERIFLGDAAHARLNEVVCRRAHDNRHGVAHIHRLMPRQVVRQRDNKMNKSGIA